jgi:hypothetical protein
MIPEPSCYGRKIHVGTDQDIIKMRGCPDCGGRGYFIANPFAPYGLDYRQCKTCWDAKQHYDAHGSLPDELAARIAAAGSAVDGVQEDRNV